MVERRIQFVFQVYDIYIFSYFSISNNPKDKADKILLVLSNKS